MFDLVQLKLISGNGGNGRVSFRREKFIAKGGPDGGNAGDGGNIFLRATQKVNTLQHFSGVKEFTATAGQGGGKQNMEGHNGESLYLEVPVGTRVWLTGENTISKKRRVYKPREGRLEPVLQPKLFFLTVNGGLPEVREPDDIKPIQLDREPDAVTEDEDHQVDELIFRSESLKNVRLQDIPKLQLVELNKEGETVLICKGGRGGRGNMLFKSSTNTTPIEAEYGEFGEQKAVLLEMRLIADVGLVGYPNAGKSTLLSIMTRANPKIASYPFTTMEPNLGVMFSNEGDGRDIVMADIPGIIEGASRGKGLGYEFLRHIQASKVLLFVLSLDETVIYQEDSADFNKAELIWQQYLVLEKELESYDQTLKAKPRLYGLSKSDLYSPELIAEVQKLFSSYQKEILPFSSLTRQGTQLLQHVLRSHI